MTARKKKNTKPRVIANIDTELAMTSDLLATAQRLACYGGWRVAVRCLYYVLLRVSQDRGRKQLAEFLNDQSAGW